MRADRQLRRDRPLFVFDGHCVLCSSGVSFIMRHDPAGRIQFLSAQSELGQAIYAHVGLPMDDSYLLIDDAGTLSKSDGYFRVASALGGWWRLGHVFRVIPRSLRDWAYDWMARNRYRLFGTSEQCALLTSEQRSRLVSDDEQLRRQLT